MTKEEIQSKIEQVAYDGATDGCNQATIEREAEKLADELVKLFAIHNVVKSLPNDEKVKAHIDTLPYYGTCTTEYNEGFEDGVKWLKEQII